MPQKKVITFGTFDILHKGHLNFFEQAKKAGGMETKLLVVVGRDLNVKQAKGTFPINNETKRLLAVKRIQIVDDVILGDLKDKLSIIEKTRPDLICLGYDQKIPDDFEKQLKNRNVKAEVRRLNAYEPEKYKSSKMKDN